MSELEGVAAERGLRRALVHVGGMSCAGCEQAVRRALSRVDGVASVTASTPKGEARVSFSAPCTAETLSEAIDASGYSCLGVEVEGAAGAASGRAASAGSASAARPARSFDAVYLLIIAVGLFLVAQNLGVNQLFQSIPTISGQNLGYTVLFGIGLLTSVHCIAMCGGINLAQSTALGETGADAGEAEADGDANSAGDRGRCPAARVPSEIDAAWPTAPSTPPMTV